MLLTKKNLKREPVVLYLDANVFIFAALNTEEKGKKALALLSKIQLGEEQAITSALTFDEVYWAVKKNRGMEKALETAEAMLNFPNLEIISADREVASLALQIIREYQLAPRDAIHAATAIKEKAETFVSTDAHFDKVKEVKRKPL
jgi:predicted nucleic acid-binding protein